MLHVKQTCVCICKTKLRHVSKPGWLEDVQLKFCFNHLGKKIGKTANMHAPEQFHGKCKKRHVFFFLAAAAWVDLGLNALQSAEQRCQRRYGGAAFKKTELLDHKVRIRLLATTQNEYADKCNSEMQKTIRISGDDIFDNFHRKETIELPTIFTKNFQMFVTSETSWLTLAIPSRRMHKQTKGKQASQ